MEFFSAAVHSVPPAHFVLSELPSGIWKQELQKKDETLSPEYRNPKP